MSKWNLLLPQAVRRIWREMSITGKFSLAFGALLVLIVLVALSSYVALTATRRQMEAAIVTSIEVQRLVLQMDAGLKNARLQEKNFFLRVPAIGFSKARDLYAQQNHKKIAEVVALSTQLQQLISQPDVSQALRESKVNLNFYLSAADRYAVAFDEAVNLEAKLSEDNTGAQVRLAHTSALLYHTILQTDNPELMLLYRQMQVFEKDYLVTRQGSHMQSAFNTIEGLRQALNQSPEIEPTQRASILAYLDNYISVAKEVLALDVEIRSKLNEFDLQAESIDPISEILIILARTEVERSRDQIARVSNLATLVLIGTILTAVIIAGVVATVFNNSITRNIIKLTDAAGQVRDGNLEVRAEINSVDELGQLAHSFNTMATRIKALVSDLEQQVVERTATNQNLQREITERKRIEAELRNYQEHLEELVKERTDELAQATRLAEEARITAESANRAKSIFLTKMSHELRTPLNAILGFSQIMQHDSTLTTKHQENLNIINRSGEHLLRLINDVLEMSKIEAGRMTLNQDICDLYHLLDDLENMFDLRAKDKGLQLHVQRLADVPRYIGTDEGKLRQILINLLNNALKFTELGHVSLRVSQKAVEMTDGKQDQTDSRIYFEVADTGPGIAPDELNTVFEAFVQTQSGRQSQTGTGLGLSISRQFVQLMGGEINIISNVGQGTILRFYIQFNPIKNAQVQPAPPAQRVIGLMSDQPVYRLLVVDDNADNRKLLVDLLAPLGFDLRQAVDGQECLEIWEQWQPDLIWMDMRMPGLDGYEATQRIKARSNGRDTVIIALTAGAFEEERAAVLAVGCDDFVPKPFQESEIFDILARYLGVRYRCEEDLSTRLAQRSAHDPPWLTVADLAALPPVWLDDLQHAVQELNLEKVNTIIDHLRPKNELMATALSGLVENFRFDTLQTLIEETKNDPN